MAFSKAISIEKYATSRRCELFPFVISFAGHPKPHSTAQKLCNTEHHIVRDGGPSDKRALSTAPPARSTSMDRPLDLAGSWGTILPHAASLLGRRFVSVD